MILLATLGTGFHIRVGCYKMVAAHSDIKISLLQMALCKLRGILLLKRSATKSKMLLCISNYQLIYWCCTENRNNLTYQLMNKWVGLCFLFHHGHNLYHYSRGTDQLIHYMCLFQIIVSALQWSHFKMGIKWTYAVGMRPKMFN